MSAYHASTIANRRLLAALVIADGHWVPTNTLRLLCQVTYPHTIVRRLRDRHGAVIQARYGNTLRVGAYRLVGLPPDCCLDRVLDAVHDLRRDTAPQTWERAS